MPASTRPPVRLLAELAGFYLVFAGVLAVLDSDAFLGRLTSLSSATQLLVHVGAALVVGLGGVALWVRRDPDPRATLSLNPIPPKQALGFGAIGFILAYACSSTLGLFYLAATRTSVNDLLHDRGPILELFSKTPLALVFPLAMVVGLYEELIFRGFVLGRLREALASRKLQPLQQQAIAVAGSATLFGLLHGYQGGYGIFQTTGAGLALGALVVWRRSLWPAVIAHASIDGFGLFALHVLVPKLQEFLHQLPQAPR
ncbi:MAG: CPBP family intramembrane metalloprotease [Deltaproteobacteria bacterium]|nr:CPBP family intramembrane metalloprotease [Deltaproteobacteria bacterium]